MKAVLVTGGTGHIGRAIVHEFLKNGYKVILHGSNSQSVKVTLDFFAEFRDRIDTLILSSDEFNDNYILDEKYCNVDILVNAVGGGGEHESWDSTSIQKWENVYRLNVIMPVFFINQTLPKMRAKRWGRIINIASVSAIKTLEIGPEYSSAKAGLVRLTESLARECKESGITANCISPGLVLTKPVQEFICSVYGLDSNESLSVINHTASKQFFPNLIGEIPLVEEIASAVAFLSSEKSGKITGQNLVVDSGYVLSDYVQTAVK